MYKDGLVRFAVTPYQDPTNNNVVSGFSRDGIFLSNYNFRARY